MALFVSAVMWGCLATLAVTLFPMDAQFWPVSTLAIGALVAFTVGAGSIRVACLLARGQRAILERFDATQAETVIALAAVRESVAQAADAYVAGLNAPRPQAEVGLRLVNTTK